MHRFSAITALTLALCLTATVAHAQRNPDYQFEIAVMPSLTYVFQDKGGESYSAITLPSIAPALRVTVWSAKPALLDFGLTVIETEGEYGTQDSYLMMECGVGLDVARQGDRFRPFGGVIAGMVSGDLIELGGYIGVQGGIRYFFREYVASRMQVGYRRTATDDQNGLRAIEIAAGLGFFL